MRRNVKMPRSTECDFKDNVVLDGTPGILVGDVSIYTCQVQCCHQKGEIKIASLVLFLTTLPQICKTTNSFNPSVSIFSVVCKTRLFGTNL
jgi:hypothetical protein